MGISTIVKNRLLQHLSKDWRVLCMFVVAFYRLKCFDMYSDLLISCLVWQVGTMFLQIGLLFLKGQFKYISSSLHPPKQDKESRWGRWRIDGTRLRK